MHLVGLQVEEIERGVWFYCEALGAEVMMRPTLMEGRTAERAMQGPPGTRFYVSVIRLGDGAVQLFSFGVGQRPDWSRSGHAGGIPQLGVQVDDVKAAIRRFERFGGKRLWDRTGVWRSAHVAYVADPDGNVVELYDVPFETIVEQGIKVFPEAAP